MNLARGGKPRRIRVARPIAIHHAGSERVWPAAARAAEHGDEIDAGRLHRSEPRLQTSVPALSGGPGVSRAIPDRRSARWCSRISGSRSTMGARHVTFGDPDFFNGPTHAARIVEALHAEFPEVTYDATIKIEHLLKHRDLLSLLRDTRMPVHHQRGRIGGRRGARQARKESHPARFLRSGRADARGGLDSPADLHRVHAVDHARWRIATC